MSVGPDALKAEPLARRMKTTKGSFYWHFKDVPDFHKAVLAFWQTDAQVELADGTSVMQLRALAEHLATQGTAEPAIRAWAKSNKTAARVLAKVDTVRLAQLETLLDEIGIANPEMARILYAAALGMRDMPETAQVGPDAMGTLVDLVLALR